MDTRNESEKFDHNIAWAKEAKSPIEKSCYAGPKPVALTQSAIVPIKPCKTHRSIKNQQLDEIIPYNIAELPGSNSPNRNMNETESIIVDTWLPTDKITVASLFHTQHENKYQPVINTNIAPGETEEHGSVALNLKISKKPIEMLIDSGASISIIKKSRINETTQIFEDNIIKLKGIGGGSISTLGSVDTEIMINPELTLQQTFSVVESDYPIKQDGIIGRDFLSHHGVDIKYSTRELIVRGQTIPLNNKDKEIILPDKTETAIDEISPDLNEEPNVENVTSLRENEYDDIFHIEVDKFSSAPVITHRLKTHTGIPNTNGCQYKLPQSMFKEVNNKISKMLDDIPKTANKRRNPKWMHKIRLKRLKCFHNKFQEFHSKIFQ